jgi:hypothetical protein
MRAKTDPPNALGGHWEWALRDERSQRALGDRMQDRRRRYSAPNHTGLLQAISSSFWITRT